MGKPDFSDEFKRDAVAQIVERGYPVAEVSQRLGVSQHSLYPWKPQLARQVSGDTSKGRRDPPAEARAGPGDRGARYLEKSHRVFRQGCKVRYAFIAEHCERFGVRAMCRCLAVQPRGYYAWQKSPVSQKAREDARQTGLLRRAWNDRGKVYGYRKLHDDLLDQGETSCPNRIARLTRLAGIKAQIGYKRRPSSYGGTPTLAVGKTLAPQFDVAAPDRAWVTDITYIRTMEGFAYLAVVIDL